MSIKEPMHPGKILKDIMMEKGYCKYFDDDEIIDGEDKKIVSAQLVYNDLNLYSYNFTKKLLNGESDIDYIVAYKLGLSIDGTDMAFWLKLQKDYDDYLSHLREEVRETFGLPASDNNFSKSISQLNDDKVCDCTSNCIYVDREYSNKKESIKLSTRSKKDYGFCAVHKNILDDILEILELDDDEHMRIKSEIKKIYDIHGWDDLDKVLGTAHFKEEIEAESNDEFDLVNSIIKCQKRIGRPIESYDDYISSYRGEDWDGFK